MSKWETQPVMLGDTMIMPLSREQGGRGPYTYQPYPKRLYKAGRPNGTSIEITGAVTVENEQQHRMQEGQGYHPGPQEAIDAILQSDAEIAKLAANRAYHDRRMSPEAQAEARAAESLSSNHLGEIPRTPIKKRGRPAKKAETVAEG